MRRLMQSVMHVLLQAMHALALDRECFNQYRRERCERIWHRLCCHSSLRVEFPWRHAARQYAETFNVQTLERDHSDGKQGELNEVANQRSPNQKRRIRHVSRNSDADNFSLPRCGGRACRAGAGRCTGHHRTRGACHRGGRLRLLLLAHVDGRLEKAIHQRHERIQKVR